MINKDVSDLIFKLTKFVQYFREMIYSVLKILFNAKIAVAIFNTSSHQHRSKYFLSDKHSMHTMKPNIIFLLKKKSLNDLTSQETKHFHLTPISQTIQQLKEVLQFLHYYKMYNT